MFCGPPICRPPILSRLFFDLVKFTCPEVDMIEEELSQELSELLVELETSRGSHQPL